MSNFDYDNARVIAENLIAKFGQLASFYKNGSDPRPFDDAGNPRTPDPVIEIAGTVTPLLSFKQHEIDGMAILATDSYVYFHSDDEPPIDSKITINSNEYRLVAIKKLGSVDGINIYRRMQLRK